MNKITRIFIIFGCFLPFLAFSSTNKVNNEVNNELRSKFNQIVEAIKVIENSKRYPYGVKSIDTGGNEEKARRICYNTVKNNYFRWQKSDKKKSYLNYLADKYCPPSADKQGNINWKKNIRSKLGGRFTID